LVNKENDILKKTLEKMIEELSTETIKNKKEI